MTVQQYDSLTILISLSGWTPSLSAALKKNSVTPYGNFYYGITFDVGLY